MSKENNNTTVTKFRDELDTQMTLFLKVTLLLISLVFFSILAVNIIINKHYNVAENYIYSTILVADVFFFILLIKGYRKLTVYITLVIIWGAMIFLTWNAGSRIYDSANIAILVIILYATILINRKTALVVASLSLINYWIIALLMIKNNQEIVLELPLDKASYYTVIIIVTVVLVFFYDKAIKNAFEKIVNLKKQKEIYQQKITSTEKSYREIFDSIDDAIFIHDPKNGKILDFNLSACAMFGYQKEEFEKLNIGSISATEDGYDTTSALEKIKEVHKIGHAVFEWKSKRANGETFWSDVQLKSSCINGENRILAVIRDISEQKKAVEKLTFNEEQYRTLISNIPGAVYRSQVHAPWKTLYFSEEILAISGYSAEEFMERDIKFGDIMHPDDRLMVASTIENSIKERCKFNLEYRIFHKDKSIRWILERGQVKYSDSKQPLWLDGVMLDITDKKITEKGLIEERNTLRTIFDTTPINLYLKDRQSRLILANKPITDPSGFTHIDVIGKTDFDFFQKEAAEEFYNDEQEMMKTGKPIISKLEHIKNNLGQEFTMLTSKQPIFDSEGQIVGLAGCGLDISERIKAEEKIKLLNESLEKKVEERTSQLAQANKDLELFAYGVSHDLRAPLRHIDAYVKIMHSKITDQDADKSSLFEKIFSASRRMSVMIDDLLNFSRLGRKPLTLGYVDLNTVIREIIELSKPDVSNRKIEWVINALPTVIADRGLIKIVFENLLSNAIKYTRKIEIAVIEIGYNEKDNNKVEIYVKDNGAGFDMNYSKKLFGVFQRLHTNEEFEGTGIGLANTKQIVIKHNGEIHAEAAINQGATFYVTLTKS